MSNEYEEEDVYAFNISAPATSPLAKFDRNAPKRADSLSKASELQSVPAYVSFIFQRSRCRKGLVPYSFSNFLRKTVNKFENDSVGVEGWPQAEVLGNSFKVNFRKVWISTTLMRSGLRDFPELKV